MRELPILFNSDMVRALIADRKTETRRVAKHQFMTLTEPPPHGQPGDILWVRETYSIFRQGGGTLQREKTKYRADETWDGNKLIKWIPSIFMPKDVARIWLRVADVRREGLQEITERGARAEGVEPLELVKTYNGLQAYKNYTRGNAHYHTNALDSFRGLWNSINEKRLMGWNKNPWVWVYQFEVISTTGKKSN